MIPTGEGVSEGIALGMTEYDFSGAAGTTKANLLNALNAQSIGQQITRGIAVGITSGKSSILTALVNAAKEALAAAKKELGIASPSKVFRDEVGVMMMRGMGVGIEEGQMEQARIIRNAARYLTEEAQGGIVAGSTLNDNRQNIQQNSSVNLSGNTFYVRSDQDIHDLAVEIATLTRTQQRGRGLRMA